MKIWSDSLTSIELAAAATVAGVTMERCREFKARKRRTGWDIILSGAGRYGGQYGGQDYKSATWDQWRIFLAELWWRDGEMTCGAYPDEDMFRHATDGRFDNLTFRDSHIQHKWQFLGNYEAECRCGALIRWGWQIRGLGTGEAAEQIRQAERTRRAELDRLAAERTRRDKRERQAQLTRVRPPTRESRPAHRALGDWRDLDDTLAKIAELEARGVIA